MSATVTIAAVPVSTDIPEEVGRAIERAAGAMTAAVALRVLDRLIKWTPKDTTLASKSWIASVGIPSPSVGGDKLAPDATLQNASRDRLMFYAISQGMIYITNNQPYILKLNAGSSSQHPGGFIEASIEDASVAAGIVDAVY